jgi:hypothetical protein
VLLLLCKNTMDENKEMWNDNKENSMGNPSALGV